MQKIYKPKYVKKILFNKNEVEKQILKAASWISNKYKNAKKPPIVLAILKGAIPFYGKLVLNINLEINFDFMVLSSYRGNIKAMQTPKIVTDAMNNITGRDVIIVEDVVDTARTLSLLVKYLKLRKPKSVKTVVLVDKIDMRAVAFKPDYACFTVKKNPFLLGWGLDVKEIARNLPYIAEFDKKYLNKI